MSINVICNGTSHPVDYSEGTSVAGLQAALAPVLRVPAGRIALIFRGRHLTELPLDEPIVDYVPLHPGSTVHAILRSAPAPSSTASYDSGGEESDDELTRGFAALAFAGIPAEDIHEMRLSFHRNLWARARLGILPTLPLAMRSMQNIMERRTRLTFEEYLEDSISEDIEEEWLDANMRGVDPGAMEAGTQPGWGAGSAQPGPGARASRRGASAQAGSNTTAPSASTREDGGGWTVGLDRMRDDLADATQAALDGSDETHSAALLTGSFILPSELFETCVLSVRTSSGTVQHLVFGMLAGWALAPWSLILVGMQHVSALARFGIATGLLCNMLFSTIHPALIN